MFFLLGKVSRYWAINALISRLWFMKVADIIDSWTKPVWTCCTDSDHPELQTSHQSAVFMDWVSTYDLNLL